MIKITIEDLEDIKESNELSKVTKKVIHILLLAMNDWPKAIKTIDEYEIGISDLVGEDVDGNRLKDYSYKIDFSQQAWEAESVSQLMEVYTMYAKEKKIKHILEEMKRDVKKVIQQVKPKL